MFDSLNIYVGRNVKQFKKIAPMKIKKIFVILLWCCRIRTKSCGTRRFCITFEKTHHFLEKSIKACHNNQQIKIKSGKANLRIREFWGKNEDEIGGKKIGKMSSIFEFYISKLGYMEVFMKIWQKNVSKCN